MTITELIDELNVALEEGGDQNEEVTVEMTIPPDTIWTGCLIDAVGYDDEGNLAIKAVAP